MCKEVIGLYETMEIPKLSNDEHNKILNDARNDVKKAYVLREKAMKSAISLINTKNLKSSDINLVNIVNITKPLSHHQE